MKFNQFFSSDFEASSKRLIAITLVAVYVVVIFLLMYIKTEVMNKDLLKQMLENLFWLILIFGGFIAAEGVLSFLKRKVEVTADSHIEMAKQGVAPNQVKQTVEKQIVNTEGGETTVENG